jgi:hypothetical protein
MTELTEPNYATQSEVRQGMNEYLRTATDVPTELKTALDNAIIFDSLENVVNAAKAIWNAGADIDANLLLVGAAVMNWISMYRFFDIGQNGDALKMRLGMLRDAGIEGTWPEIANDPQRASTVPVMAPMLPLTAPQE